ncbi:MAG: type IV secretory system conjugative DNA transfer family protein [Myxococcota bacterium]
MLRFLRTLVSLCRHFRMGTLSRLLVGLYALLWGLLLLAAIWLVEPRSLDHAMRTGFAQGWTLALLGPVAGLYAIFYAWSFVTESALWRKLFAHGRGGSSRFAGPVRLLRQNWAFCRQAPIYLGRSLAKYDPLPFCQDIGVDDDNHLLTIAQPGSGKSTTAIWPNLIRHPYPDSTFLFDPKGEHSLAVFEARAKLGPVYILDPQKQTRGLPTVDHNPLDEIDVHAGDAKERLNELGDACYVSTGSSKEHPHFKDICIATIAGVCGHIKTWPGYPPETHNLPGVYDLLIRGDTGRKNSNEPPGAAFERLLDEMEQNPAAGGAPMEAARLLRSAGREEYGSIFTTLIRCIRWVSSTNMRQHLLRSDFRLAELREKVCTIIVVLDFDDMAPEKQGRYMRVLLYQAMAAARKTPMPAPRVAAGRRTLFILDEVGMLGSLEAIERNYKILRASRVKLWCLFQEVGTLKASFSNPDAILASSTKQFFGVSEPSTAELIEKYLGKYRERFGSGQGRQAEETKLLLDAGDIMDTLRQDALMQIVITGRGDKFELKRVLCYPPARPSGPPAPPVPTDLPVPMPPRSDSVNGIPAHPAGPDPEVVMALRVLCLREPYGFEDLERARTALEAEARRSRAMARVIDGAHDLLFARLIR